MHIRKLIWLAEQPPRPIHRRWARYIGPYECPDEFVKVHDHAHKKLIKQLHIVI